MPDAARNHAPAAGAGNLTLIDARLSSRSSRYKTDLVTNGECGLKAVILDTEPAALGRHLIPRAQYHLQALPAFWFNRLTVSFADQTRFFE